MGTQKLSNLGVPLRAIHPKNANPYALILTETLKVTLGHTLTTNSLPV